MDVRRWPALAEGPTRAAPSPRRQARGTSRETPSADGAFRSRQAGDRAGRQDALAGAPGRRGRLPTPLAGDSPGAASACPPRPVLRCRARCHHHPQPPPPSSATRSRGGECAGPRWLMRTSSAARTAPSVTARALCHLPAPRTDGTCGGLCVRPGSSRTQARRRPTPVPAVSSAFHARLGDCH